MCVPPERMLHGRLVVRAVGLSCGIVLALVSTSAAQTEADADVLLREGAAFAESGDHARAVAWFERARALAPSERIDLNLAESLIALGEYRRAEMLLLRLVEEPSVNPLIAEVAREQLAALHERMGVLVVAISPVPERAWLAVDGRRVTEARPVAELRVLPGSVRLAVVGEDGTVLARARATVGERDRANVALSPVQLEAPPVIRGTRQQQLLTQTPTAPTPPAESIDPWPWIGGALAVVVALAAGIGIGAAIWAPMNDVVPATSIGSH